MNSKWTKFTETGRSFRASITISANGYIGISEGACTRWHLKDCKAVVLYYNEEEQKVGLEFVEDEKVEGARKLRIRTRGADISAGPFLDRFDIKPHDTVKFEVVREEETGLLVIDLRLGKKRHGKIRHSSDVGLDKT